MRLLLVLKIAGVRASGLPWSAEEGGGMKESPALSEGDSEASFWMLSQDDIEVDAISGIESVMMLELVRAACYMRFAREGRH